MIKIMFAIVMLSTLLAGAALAGTCSTYCGTFAGHRWCNNAVSMMAIIAPVIMGIVLFYWLAFMGTIWAWLQAIFHLCQLHFIRASLWFVAGTWMLFWWYDEPRGWDDFAPGAIAFIVMGVAGTSVRFLHRRQRTLRAAAETQVDIAPEIEFKVETDRHPKKRSKTINLVENNDGVWVPE